MTNEIKAPQAEAAPPAFPLADSCCEYGGTNRSDANGMSLRDYFAAHASEADVNAWITGPVCLQIKTDSQGGKYEYNGPLLFSREQARYRFADAMLKARGGAA